MLPITEAWVLLTAYYKYMIMNSLFQGIVMFVKWDEGHLACKKNMSSRKRNAQQLKDRLPEEHTGGMRATDFNNN